MHTTPCFQEGHDLGQLALDVVDTGHIGKGHLGVMFDINPRARLAHPHQPAQPLFLPQPVEQEVPQRQHHQQRHECAQHGRYRAVFGNTGEGHARAPQLLAQCRVDAHGGEHRMAIDRLLQPAEDTVMLDMQVADLLLIEQLQELAVRDGLHGRLAEQAELHGCEHRQADCQ